MLNIEIKQLSELQQMNRGITGTDTVIVIAVDGKQIGYCDDYGTFTPFERDDVVGLGNPAVKLGAERLVEMATQLHIEITDGGGSAR